MTSTPALTRAAVIGHPVDHSLSPAMFNAMFEQEKRDWRYDAVEVTDETLGSFIHSLQRNGIGAFSVTMPLKSIIVDHLDGLDSIAAALHAVNSVRVTPDGLMGYNTDGEGCCEALARVGGANFEGAQSVVFGAGGTARSVALSLASRGAQVIIVNRTQSTAADAVRLVAAAQPGCSVRVGTLDDVRRASIVVNATPAGMGANSETTIVDGTMLPSGAVVLDAVYQPLETLLLRSAREQGCTVVDGLWMLVHQAMRQYTLWFGTNADASVMRAAAERELSRRHK